MPERDNTVELIRKLVDGATSEVIKNMKLEEGTMTLAIEGHDGFPIKSVAAIIFMDQLTKESFDISQPDFNEQLRTRIRAILDILVDFRNGRLTLEDLRSRFNGVIQMLVKPIEHHAESNDADSNLRRLPRVGGTGGISPRVPSSPR